MKISKINFYPLKSGVVILEIRANDGASGIGQFIGNSYLCEASTIGSSHLCEAPIIGNSHLCEASPALPL